MTHQIKVLSVEGSKMEVFVFEPEGKGPFPGLVQFMHIPVGHKRIENDEFTLKNSEEVSRQWLCGCRTFYFSLVA